MNALIDLLGKGGPAMTSILILSVLLYSRCFKLFLSLRHTAVDATGKNFSTVDPSTLQRWRTEVQQDFRQQRISLGAMIAAAPLLGLLGTVSGMAKTFDSLTTQAGGKSMEGLARGISEVLVSTEAGLVVAIPALLTVFLAHRLVRHQTAKINRLEQTLRRSRTI